MTIGFFEDKDKGGPGKKVQKFRKKFQKRQKNALQRMRRLQLQELWI